MCSKIEPDNVKTQPIVSLSSTDANLKPITSYIMKGMTNSQWMKKFDSIKSNHVNHNDVHVYYEPECNAYNWMNGLYQLFTPNVKWNYYKNTKIIKYVDGETDIINNYNNQTIIIVMDDKDDLNKIKFNLSDLSTFKQWTVLGDSSILIRRVFDLNDINLFGRFIEWLWAKDWIPHIQNDPRCTKEYGHYACRKTIWELVRVEDVTCWKCGCLVEKTALNNDKYTEILEQERFYQISSKTKTDKVRGHQYHKLYNKLLEPFFNKNRGHFVEIGLGCNMKYGVGESAKIWPQLFNNIHFIEYDKNCTKYYQYQLKDNSEYMIHIGSQEDIVFMEELKEIYWSDLGIDIVIDDGGHWNKQIISSFLQLWPLVNRNGYYFMEDFQESAYMIDYLDSKPINYWGGEKPGTAQYFIKKQLLYHLFCHITKRSCYDLE